VLVWIGGVGKAVNVSSKRYDPRWADWLWLCRKDVPCALDRCDPGIDLVAVASSDASKVTADFSDTEVIADPFRLAGLDGLDLVVIPGELN
jgi:hypothetical protein